MFKKILVFYLLWTFLINASFVIAYHGGKGGGDPISLSKAMVIIIGGLATFILVIWFFRNANINTEKSKK